jgi:hypothetical protein
VTLQISHPASARHAKALIFSPAGHGKTHLLGTAEEDERTSPMLLLDFEGGDETLSGLDIDMAKIRSWDDYSEAFEILSDPDTKYKSVGIDSASETHIWAILTRLKALESKRSDKDLVELGDYGAVSTQMRRLLREFRDLPMHVFYTATTKEIEERGVGKVKVPAMSGQMADEIVALMSIVGYLALTPGEEDIDRMLLLQNYPGFRTKVRSPWNMVPPDEIEDPTITKLLDALEFPMNGQPARRTRSRKKSTSTEE